MLEGCTFSARCYCFDLLAATILCALLSSSPSGLGRLEFRSLWARRVVGVCVDPRFRGSEVWPGAAFFPFTLFLLLITRTSNLPRFWFALRSIFFSLFAYPSMAEGQVQFFGTDGALPPAPSTSFAPHTHTPTHTHRGSARLARALLRKLPLSRRGPAYRVLDGCRGRDLLHNLAAAHDEGNRGRGASARTRTHVSHAHAHT